MKNNNNETITVAFTMENILNGSFAKENNNRLGSKSSWKMHTSFANMIAFGFELSEEVQRTVKNMTYKWVYYTNEDNKTMFIIAFHTKKAPKEWIYGICDSLTGAITESFTNIQDAKSYIK